MFQATCSVDADGNDLSQVAPPGEFVFEMGTGRHIHVEVITPENVVINLDLEGDGVINDSTTTTWTEFEKAMFGLLSPPSTN